MLLCYPCDKICKLFERVGSVLCVVIVWTIHQHHRGTVVWPPHIKLYYEGRPFSIAPFVPISVQLFTGFLEAYLNTWPGIFTFVTVNPSA